MTLDHGVERGGKETTQAREIPGGIRRFVLVH